MNKRFFTARRAYGFALVFAFLVGILCGVTPREAQAESGPGTAITIDMEKLLTGDVDNAPKIPFTFSVTQVVDATGADVVPDGLVVEDVKVTDVGDFTVSLPDDLPEGTYYFKISEVNENTGGDETGTWTYDPGEYTVKVVKDSSGASVYYPDGAVNGGVWDIKGDDQSIAFSPDAGQVIVEDGNYSHETQEMTEIEYSTSKPADGDHVMHYRYIADGSGGYVCSAYCIDYQITPESGSYSPFIDYNGFVEYFGQTMKDKYGITNGYEAGRYKEFLWLARNGFWSSVKRSEDDGSWSGGVSNIEAIREITGVGDLTEDEAYAATQLAVWRFSNGVRWFSNENANENGNGGKHVIKSDDVYSAHVKLIEAAEEAVANGDVITSLSLSANFDISGATLDEDGWFGPITPSAKLLPVDFVRMEDIDVTVTANDGVYLSKDKTSAEQTTLTLTPGSRFFVKPSDAHIKEAGGSKVASAVAKVKVSSTVKDVYVLRTGMSANELDAGQPVIGIGAYKRNDTGLSANAALYYYGIETSGGKISFVNNYKAPTSEPTSETPTETTTETTTTTTTTNPVTETTTATSTTPAAKTETTTTSEETTTTSTSPVVIPGGGGGTPPEVTPMPSAQITPTPAPIPAVTPTTTPSSPQTPTTGEEIERTSEPGDPDETPEVPETTTEAPVAPDGGNGGGGTDQNVPPAPSVPGNPILPDGDDYLELGEDGVPLGTWEWNPDTQEWEFDDTPPPLSVQNIEPTTTPALQDAQTFYGMPKTGDGAQGVLTVTFGLSLMIAGVFAQYSRVSRKRQSHSRK